MSKPVVAKSAILNIRVENIDPTLKDSTITSRLRDSCLHFSSLVNIRVGGYQSRDGKLKRADVHLSTAWEDNRILSSLRREDIGKLPLKVYIRSSSPVESVDPGSTRSTPRRRRRLAAHIDF